MLQKTSSRDNFALKKKIAIIGGGIGGLLCGYYLSRKGHKVTVLESKKFLGGFLETKKYKGITYEAYYHHIFLNDFKLLELIDELGLSSNIIWKKSSSASFINGAFFPTNSFFDWLRFPDINLINKIKGGKLIHNIYQKKAEQYHNMSAYEFIGSSLGLSFLNNFWKPLFEKKFSYYAKSISAAWFVSRLQKRAGKRKSSQEILGYMKGSFQLLIDRLHSSILQNGGKIKLSTTIGTIDKNGSLYMIDGKKFDRVVCTIANPVSIFKKILPQKDILEQSCIPYFCVVCARIILKRKLSDYYWVNILDKSIPFVSFVEQTNLFKYDDNNFHLSYLGWYISEKQLKKIKRDEIIIEAKQTVKKMFPSFDENLKIDVSIGRYAQPVISAKIKVPPITTSDKNIFITNMDHIFPEDRGLNEAVVEAQKISKMLS